MTTRRNWLDRAIEAIDPQRALRRAHARGALAYIGGSDSYASTDPRRRVLRGWDPRPSSADAATIPALVDLRAQSRDLIRKNPIAGGAIATQVASVVGTGLSVQPQILAKRLGLSVEAAAAWEAEAKEWFELWESRPEWCDVCGDLNFYAAQDLVMRSACESGDCFSMLPMIRQGDEPLETKFQLIEADRVCNPRVAYTTESTEEFIGGIKCDKYGRPMQAAIADKHPGGISYGTNTWTIVDFFGANTGRRNLIQLIPKLRPGQRRGVPYLAPIIEIVHQLGTYTDAEVRAAVVSAAFTVFVKMPVPEKPPPLNMSTNGTPQQSAAAPVAGQQLANEVRLESGAILDLAPGEDVAFADPARPNEKFDPFVQAVFVQIGMALEIPYEVLISRFTASYSAARAALLRFWLTVRRRREWLAAGWCQPVYEAVISECVMRGKLKAPGFLRDPLIRAAYLRSVWIGDAPGTINPKDEAEAAKTRLEIGITDKPQETIAFSGRNWEDVQAQRKRVKAIETEDGTLPEPPATPGMQPKQPGAPAPDGDKPEQGDKEGA